MTILDTFYILFKTDAGPAKTDLVALEKQIDTLKEKGKKRSEQENKDLKEMVARQKELAQGISDSTKESDKFVDSIADATAALVGFAAVRAGITKSSSFNSDLKVQSELLQQSARDLKVYGAAAEAAGGSKEGMLATISAWYNGAIAAGITNPGKFSDWTANLQKRLALAPDIGAKNQIIDSLGLPIDPGFRRELLNPAEFSKQLDIANKNIGANDADFESARETQSKLSHIGQTLDNIWTKINTFIGPGASSAIQGVGGTVLEGLGGWAILKKFLGGRIATAAGSAATGAGEALVGGAATVGGAAVSTVGAIMAGAVVAGLSIFNHRGVSSFLDNHGLNPFAEGGSSGMGNLSKGLYNTKANSLAFWMSQGYTREQAAGLVANEDAESGGDPRARGKNGEQSFGLFQWHPDRVEKIFEGTGIDVRTASHEDQLKAAAWELQQRGQADQLRKITNAGDAGAFISNKFEIPADMTGEAVRRAQSALRIASDYGAPSSAGKSVSVKIEKIEVNTKATDAVGIAQGIGEHLSSILGHIAAEMDDGVYA